MKKLKFEWWWLWIPVAAITSIPFLQSKEMPIIQGGIYISLFTLAVIGIAFHPRKPTVIYSHLNTMLRHFYWIVSGAALVLLWSAFGQAASGLDLPAWLDFVLFLSVVVLMGLSVAYVLYWSQPYSRKRSGVAAVDAAIERYRKPGEIVQSAWMPDMVVDGGRYRVAAYFQNEHSAPEILGFTLDGKVVRDEVLMSKIFQCMKLAGNIMHPQSINWRAEAYKNTQKALRLGRLALRKWSSLFGGLPPEYAAEVEWLRRGLEMWLEFAEGVCRYWYLEAEYGMRHGNTKMKEVRYEDVEWLNEQVDVYRREQERLEAWEPVFRAMRILDNFLHQQPQYRTRERAALVEVIRDMDVSLRTARKLQTEGIVAVPYIGMTSEVRKNWLSRLAWVDVVDRWVAQGLTGEALEAKKAEYLAEQARLERQRKREERAARRKQKVGQQDSQG